VSNITANIIQSIETKNRLLTDKFLYTFIGVSLLFLCIYYVYKNIQNGLLTKMTQWIKSEIFKIILLSNNESMKQVNFIEFITPITRISVSCYVLFFDLITVIIPTMSFLVIIAGFFLYTFAPLGLLFIFANLLIFLYLWWFWDDLTKEKSKHETKINVNEKFIIDILNNIDKVIYRGQNKNEIHKFETMTNECIQTGVQFLSYTTNHVIAMTGIVYLTIFGGIYYLIRNFYSSKKPLSPTTFITCMTILLLYRDRMLGTIQNLPDYLEFIGRIQYIMDDFKKMIGENKDMREIIEKAYPDVKLAFTHIEFKNVGFKYNDVQAKPVFDNLNVDMNTDHKVIGITGLSGKGKSSFAKLILRLYEPTTGNIYIDGTDISTVDPNYIRSNITYVNQNSKLFDKKVIDNIVYGCNDLAVCDKHLEEILKYKKIQELYKNVDIRNMNAGSLGENLSGGQRQVINIISGLINPSKILILDEPTNALDADLKSEVIALINYYRKHKNCIIIITHDRDVYSIFDETVKI
jgi:ABC-type multidrug transport system fused ATPase/permease subunit